MDPQGLFGPVATRTHQIDNFDTFILNNVPYGEVRLRDLQLGVVQYDGPGVAAINGSKPALQWHFGGVPYPITKAIRIPYTYIRTFDGSNTPSTEQIFIGFQQNLTDFILPQPIPYVASPTQTYRSRVSGLGPFGVLGGPVWASDAGVLASQCNDVVTRSVQHDPGDYNLLNTFIRQELGWDQAPFDALLNAPIAIDFDGPAQDSDSHHVFQYTFATLVNDPYRYGQLLFWYFGGKPYRVTKAVRIPLDFQFGFDAVQPSHVLQAVDGNPNPKTGEVPRKSLHERLRELTGAAGPIAPATASGSGAASRARRARGAEGASSSSDPTTGTSDPTGDPGGGPGSDAGNGDSAGGGSATTGDGATAPSIPSTSAAQGFSLFIGFAGSSDPGG